MKRIGVLGGISPQATPRVYLDPLGQRGVQCATIGGALPARLDDGIRAVMEGREGVGETAAVDGIVLGCTEIPLLLGEASEAGDLVNPLALLAEATVRFATGGMRAPLAALR
jgi:aspartate/glutamate racemase